MFRSAISPIFWFLLVVGLSIGLPSDFLLVGLSNGWRATARIFPNVAAGIALGALGSIFFAYLFHFFFSIRISPDGVSAYSAWGIRRFIAWQHIASVRPIRILNLRYLRLYSSTDRKTTWLPLFVTDSPAFRTALKAAVPSDNPVLTYIK